MFLLLRASNRLARGASTSHASCECTTSPRTKCIERSMHAQLRCCLSKRPNSTAHLRGSLTTPIKLQPRAVALSRGTAASRPSYSKTARCSNEARSNRVKPDLDLRSHGLGENAPSSSHAFDISPPVKQRLLRSAKREQLRSTERVARQASLIVENSTDWSFDWTIPLEILRSDYANGRYTLSENFHHAVSSQEQQAVSQATCEQISPWSLSGPDDFTKQAFLDFIQRIVSTKVPRSAQRTLYDLAGRNASGNAHQFQIQMKLESVFRNESWRPIFSTEAFETALTYLDKKGMAGASRVLLNLMIESKVPLKPSTFNILTEGAVLSYNLRFFTYLMRLKRALRIPSNAHMWGALLRIVSSKRVKLRILREMEELGVLNDPTAARLAIAATWELSLSRKSDLGADHDMLASLVTRYDERFGRDWLTETIGNELCSHFGTAGEFRQVSRVLDLMAQRGATPTTRTLTTLLRIAAYTNEMDRALRLIKYFQQMYGVHCQPEQWPILFEQAWSMHSFNTCRVLWRLTCIHGTTTARMRHLVVKSLARNTPVNPTTPHERWNKEAGKIICYSRPENSAALDALLAGEFTPLTGLKGDRDVQLQLASDIMQCDWLSYGQFSLVTDWLRLYEEAVRLDMDWRVQRVLVAQPLLWKHKHALSMDEFVIAKKPTEDGPVGKDYTDSASDEGLNMCVRG